MKKIGLIILAVVSFAACDLQPKIVSLPDTVGDFISSRYPALLADPNTESDIYNSAARDYGVYASPELYGSGDMGDYVNYAGVDDYVLPDDDNEENVTDESEETDDQEESEESDATDNTEDTESDVENTEPAKTNDATDEEETDVLDIPEYQTDEINVPVRAAAGTVVVRRGDTLYAIARENNMTLDEIARANNLSAPYTIRIGQTLKVKSETPSKSEVKDTPKVEKDVVKETAKQPVKKLETPKPETKNPEKTQAPKTDKAVQKTDAKPEAKAPVTNNKPEPKVQKEVRVPIKDIKVARGDTLYSISREYSVPVNDLAVMNGLSAPFALSVGQTLRVPDLQVRKAEATKKSTAATTKVADKKSAPKQVSGKQDTTTKKESKATKEPAKKTEAVKKTDAKKAEPKKQDVKKIEKTDSKKTVQNKTTSKTTSKTDTPKIAARSSSKFSWPVRGTVLSHYGAKTGGLYNDGINISAALNTSVVAAENGVVAYAGNEVRGMGNLVIIQHADGWMTVYAHMNSMTVRRGARVSVGQKIGTVGKTGKVTTPQLHFEVRKGTKAYNPINYLKK